MRLATGRWVSGNDFVDRESECGFWMRGFAPATTSC